MFLHPLQNLETLGASEYTVMSQEGTWKMGDSTSTVLYTKEDEVVATRDTHREKESAGSSRFACYLYSLVLSFGISFFT